MSTITEAAELEAAIAENELDETAAARLHELIEEGSPRLIALEQVLAERDGSAPPPTLPAEPSGEPTEKQWATLNRENDRHVKRVRDIMGAAVDGFTECEACSGVGIVPPGPPPPEPQTHEFFKACETCAGFGEVLTGSLREGQASRDCPACGGRGYLEALDPNGAPLAGQGSAPPQAPPPPPRDVVEAALAPAGGNGAEPRYGVPSWMGDPNLGT